jgi:hypothetical protein
MVRWIVFGIVAWLTVGFFVAVVFGRVARERDRHLGEWVPKRQVKP